jgi:hypothetical protein
VAGERAVAASRADADGMVRGAAETHVVLRKTVRAGSKLEKQWFVCRMPEQLASMRRADDPAKCTVFVNAEGVCTILGDLSAGTELVRFGPRHA